MSIKAIEAIKDKLLKLVKAGNKEAVTPHPGFDGLLHRMGAR
jgi:hypothetical protein